MRKLILVRHGETDKNLRNSLHTDKDPETLNRTGRVQMFEVAKALKNYLPFQLYSSQEKRAVESAEIIAKQLNIDTSEIAGLQERNWGIYSGKTWDYIKKVLDPMSLNDRYNFVPDDGESWKDFENRLKKALNQVLGETKENVVVITHGGAIRALMPYLLGAPREESFKYDPDNASITIFEISNNGFENVLVNNTDHLK